MIAPFGTVVMFIHHSAADHEVEQFIHQQTVDRFPWVLQYFDMPTMVGKVLKLSAYMCLNKCSGTDKSACVNVHINW